jgi:hypothetical protein
VTAVLVDSNVLLDILGEENAWTDWSASTLRSIGNTDRLIINPVIYGEVSVRFSSVEALDEALPETISSGIDYPLPPPFWPAKRSWRTGGEAAPANRCCPTS